jgi:endonuclease YncB( thermonuclease family)
LIALALAVSLALGGMEPHGSANAAECTLKPGPSSRTAVRIIDSETFALDNGSTVRLIGALAPRRFESPDDQAIWPPEQDAKTALERLVLGKPVELEIGGRQTDRYGRVLAHAFVQDNGRRIWVQEQLLRHGNARAYALRDSDACMDALLAAERDARDAKSGLWAHAAYQIKSADQIGDLLRERGSYQIVEGRVVDAADVRGQLFLNFGENWRTDFSASARPRERKAIEEAGLDLKSLKGKLVRIRGWIDRRSGPAIELHHISQIEVLMD